jgi:hypothetical protein
MTFDWRRVSGISIAVGGGQIPTRRYFATRTQSIWVGANLVHPNPHFFKYTWQIWTAAEAVADDWRMQGRARPWRETTPELCFFDAIARMRRLFTNRECFLVVNYPHKRDDPEAPWDAAAVRGNGRYLIAPALADDPDPEFHGHR